MSIRYSYGNFTTKGHGVIEYADPSSYEDGKKPKRRTKIKPKFATRWPSAAPLKLKAVVSMQKTKTLHQQAQVIFKQRNPGQQPKKGQIKVIMKELQRRVGGAPKSKKQTSKVASPSLKTAPDNRPKIDEITLHVYNRRFPGQKPSGDQLRKLRLEVVNERKKLGL